MTNFVQRRLPPTKDNTVPADEWNRLQLDIDSVVSDLDSRITVLEEDLTSLSTTVPADTTTVAGYLQLTINGRNYYVKLYR